MKRGVSPSNYRLEGQEEVHAGLRAPPRRYQWRTMPDALLQVPGRLAPAATIKLSHARIMRGYRDPTNAERFHNLVKEAT